MLISFSVPFVHGKERPRFGQGRARTGDATERNERAIRAAYMRASRDKYGGVAKAPDHVPVKVLVACELPAPRRRPGWCPRELWERLGGVPFVKVPDWDNVGKEVTDALNGVAYRDDAQVTDAHVRKLARRVGGVEQTRVTVMWAEEG